MEEVSGIPGTIPPLAIYPPANVQATLPPAEWEACLDSWLFSIEYRLKLQDTPFSKFKFSHESSGFAFLQSLFDSCHDGRLASSSVPKERLLHRRSYLLLRRLLLGTEVPLDLEGVKLVELLGGASLIYASIADWATTLRSLWTRNQTQMRNAVESWKKAVSVDLSNASSSSTLLARYRRINALVKSSAETGLTLMTGSDYLESLLEAYNLLQKTSDTMDAQKTLTEHIYYCLRSLMFDGLRRDSMLLDHLYHMKSESDRVIKSDTHHSTLCSSLVCTTSFLRHLTADGAVSSTKRGQGLVDSLSTLRQNTMQLHPQIALRRRTVGKGKGKSKTDTNEEMHMHNASQVSKVHELFPDLPNKYILQLLDNFNDDTESVIAGLLEPDSLPTHLQDHGTRESDSPTFGGPSHDLAPHSTPPLPPQRKNVFDNDEFDNLRISSGHLHKGRKTLNVDQPKDGNANARSKAAILAALAAFDSDDDERDDTYDVADVGGTVDSTVDTDSRPRPVSKVEQNPHEESLYRAWKSNQEIFARDSTTRVSKVRQDLKQETGMSDEQIEGWAIMLKKDSRLQNSLEKKYSTMRAFGGNQPALGATRWQGETPEDSEEGEAVGGGRRTGQAQIRGHRTWGRGRGGGSTAGASNDTATQAARKRKEQGRGRGGASHHRREGRAKKMGRGMAGLSGQ